MFTRRPFFATMAIAFVFVLVGAACTESASTRDAEAPAAAAPAEAAPAEAAPAEAAPAEEAHAEEAHAEEAHAEEASHGPAGEERIIEVTMTEFAFDPASVQVAAGETVTFVVTNAGVVEHEFRLSNEHRIEEHLASGHAGHGEEAEEGGHHGDGDMVLLVPAGETGELTVTFPSDATVYTHIACLIPGHFEADMEGAIGYTA